MNNKKSTPISRREFARRAAIASAAASLVPANVFGAGASLPAPQEQQSPNLPQLLPQSQAEVEARIQAIFGQYGSRFSEEQKADIRRLCHMAQPPLDHLRAYAIENGDGPSLYLKPLVEREKKPAAAPASKTPANPKKGS